MNIRRTTAAVLAASALALGPVGAQAATEAAELGPTSLDLPGLGDVSQIEDLRPTVTRSRDGRETITIKPSTDGEALVITASVNEPAVNDSTNGLVSPLAAVGNVKYIQCFLSADNPHYSTGAPGVIGKVKWNKCTGNHTMTLWLQASIFRAAPNTTGPWLRDINADVYTLRPGSTGVHYVPERSKKGIYCNLSHVYWTEANYAVMSSTNGTGQSGVFYSNFVNPQKCS